MQSPASRGAKPSARSRKPAAHHGAIDTTTLLRIPALLIVKAGQVSGSPALMTAWMSGHRLWLWPEALCKLEEDMPATQKAAFW